MASLDPNEQRSATRDAWERAAAGWGKRADRIRDWGMPVSAAMVEALALRPGQRVLELAAGPGDTGFMAAQLVGPGGTLVSSDGADAMLDVARARAAELGVDNVEFRQLELEWIDLETATVDAVIVRWGIMLIVDPEAAAREVRRILRPGGRAAFAVWDTPQKNPWAVIPGRAMVELGHAEPPEPGAPGMFSLAGDGQLAELLEGAGFQDVVVSPVSVTRHYDALDGYLEETLDMSPLFSATYRELSADEQAAAVAAITTAAQPFVADDGSVT
ncbi:MAG TPA: methyltransferase domain-containing protein, partial [Solirubrobacteraceae bacterium]|nr:methyltransferase domain-containing protein [Solirubrobacteraceae bacterium]